MKKSPETDWARLHPSQVIPGASQKKRGGKRPVPVEATGMAAEVDSRNDWSEPGETTRREEAARWEIQCEELRALLSDLIQDRDTPAIGGRVVQRYEELGGQVIAPGCGQEPLDHRYETRTELRQVLAALIRRRPKNVPTIGRRALCLAFLVKHSSVQAKDLAHLAREIGVTKEALCEMTDELSQKLGIPASWQRSKEARSNMRAAALASRERRDKQPRLALPTDRKR